MKTYAVAAVLLAITAIVGCAPADTPGKRPAAAHVVGCQPHIEVFGAEHWARELGQSETQVLANYRINLWANGGANRGGKVGELRPGARAVILEATDDSYRVQGGEHQTGWVSKIQVARTLNQDVESRQPCASPAK